jgi:hypothetical protein
MSFPNAGEHIKMLHKHLLLAVLAMSGEFRPDRFQKPVRSEYGCGGGCGRASTPEDPCV